MMILIRLIPIKQIVTREYSKSILTSGSVEIESTEKEIVFE
jgi:hypothetical protein